MIILAFDQSSRTSGYSIFEDNKLKEHGTFTFSNNDLGIRLYKIRQKVEELINLYHPDKIIFEDIQLQDEIYSQKNVGNVKTFKTLAEVFGIIYELATELNIDNEAYLAGTWRKGLGIAGNHRDQQKANAQKWVYDNYGIKVVDDEADAICIGAYGAGIRTSKQKEAKKLQPFDWS